MTGCYVLILQHVRASKRRVAAGGAKTQPPPPTTQPSNKPHTDMQDTTVQINVRSKQSRTRTQTKESVLEIARRKKIQKRKMEDLKLAMSFIVVTTCFVISWLPFCVTMFWSVFSPTPVPRILDMATLLLGCSNSCGNPIVYGLMNASFRDGFLRIFYCGRRGRLETTQNFSVSIKDTTNC